MFCNRGLPRLLVEADLRMLRRELGVLDVHRDVAVVLVGAEELALIGLVHVDEPTCVIQTCLLFRFAF